MPWYVVQTNPNCETRAETSLTRAGYRVYLPRVKVERIHHRFKRRIVREHAMMPRYLFVAQPDIAPDWFTLRRCDGVMCVLGDSSGPRSVPARQIDALREVEDSGELNDTRETRPVKLRRRFKADYPVKILTGAFAGFPGVVAEVTNNAEVRVMVELLGRLVPVLFDDPSALRADSAAA